MSDEELISQDDAARLCGKSARSIRRWELPVVKEEGRHVYYRRADVEAEHERRRANDINQRQHARRRGEHLPFGGNIVRILHWSLCVALTQTLQRCIAIAAKSDDWKGRFSLTDQQVGAIGAYVAMLVPQIIDTFLANHYDRWFLQENDTTVDELATTMILKRVRIQSSLWKPGEFNEATKGSLPEPVRELLTASVLEFIRDHAVLKS